MLAMRLTAPVSVRDAARNLLPAVRLTDQKFARMMKGLAFSAGLLVWPGQHGCKMAVSALVAPSFNGRTAASGAAYRGSNPWGAATNQFFPVRPRFVIIL